MLVSRPRSRLGTFVAYVVALLAAALVYAACLSLQGTLRGSTPLSLFLLAVIPAAWIGGIGPGLLASAASVLLGHLILAAHGIGPTEQLARLAVIGFVGVVISLLAGMALHSRDRLQSERTRLAALLDNLPAGAILAEAPSGRIVLANRSVQEILGHSPDTPDIAAYALWQAMHADGRPLAPHEYPLVRAVRGESLSGQEYRYRHEEGREVWIRASGAPVYGEGGSITGGVVVFWNIDREKRLLAELETERERLRLAQNAARVGTFEWNIASGQNRWSPEIEALYGVPVGAFEGNYEAWRRRVHPEDIARAESDVQRALQDGEFHSEWRVVLPDGRIRHMQAFARVLFDSEGRPERMLGVNVDVTARHEAEQELRSVRRNLEQALEAGRLGAFHLELASGEMSCTPGCKANFGRAATEPFGYADFLASLHEEDRPAVAAAVKRAIEQREPYRAEYRVRWPNGSLHWIAARGEVRHDAGGTAMVLDGVTADVTEQRALEEQLRAQAAELREADRRKDQFLATLSHELRSPLQAIGSAVALLRRSIGDGDATHSPVAHATEVISRQVGHVSRLVDDLLEVARIVEGKLQLEKRVLDATEVIATAADTVQPQLERRRQTLRVEHGNGPLPVRADPARLTQVMVNLLSNASKYTAEGGAISISAEVRDGDAAIRVRDNGVGIPPQMLSRVFDVFMQVDEHRALAGGGLGIGLNVVQRLVELHGGSVMAHSEGPNKGAEFIVRLPLAQGAQAASRRAQPDTGNS